MTLLNSIRIVAILTSCLAVLGGALPAPAYAEPIVFQFQSTIDARPAGGQANEQLLVTYAFDSNLQNGTGPLGTSDTTGSYGPIVMTIQLGDQIVTATGPGTGITIFNNAGTNTIQDSYEVRVDNSSGTTNVTGTLFGMQVSFFRFLLVDNEALMFNSTDLPLSPVFAELADFQQTEFDLFDPLTGEDVFFALNEMPVQKNLTPFSLTLSYDPIFEIVIEIAALELPQTLQDPLLQKLNAAVSSVTSEQPNATAAIGQLQAFIDQIEAQSGKSLSPQEADDLAGAAQLVILGLLAGG